MFIRWYTRHITLRKTDKTLVFICRKEPTAMFSWTASDPVAKYCVNQASTSVEVTATYKQNRVSDGLKARAVFKTESLSPHPDTLVSTAGTESPWLTTNGSSFNKFSRQAHVIVILVCSYVCVCKSSNVIWPKLWRCYLVCACWRTKTLVSSSVLHVLGLFQDRAVKNLVSTKLPPHHVQIAKLS